MTKTYDTERYGEKKILDVPLAIFDALPDHPQQRNTGVHAALLMARGVMTIPLPPHDDVAAVIVGDLAMMQSAFERDPLRALKQHGSALNGHSRRQMWREKVAPAPETLNLTTYFAVDDDAAFALYRCFDNLTAAKSLADTAQSTVKMAGIEAHSQLIKAAKGLSKAVTMATAILEDGALRFKSPPAKPTNARTIEEGLPALRYVRLYRTEIETLDKLDLPPKGRNVVPTGPAALAGYLACLKRNPAKALEFLTAAHLGRATYADGKMSATYVVRGIANELKVRKARSKWKPADLDERMVAAILNAFESYSLNDKATFDADAWPLSSAVITKFFAEPTRPRRRGGDEAVGHVEA